VSDLRTPSEQVKNVYLNYTAEEREALNAPVRIPWLAPVAARRKAAEQKMKAAEEKVREAIAAAADSLPSSAPSPQALLKRR
jgi:stearoyl-CoA desaturase (delta-9 desaturase)